MTDYVETWNKQYGVQSSSIGGETFVKLSNFYSCYRYKKLSMEVVKVYYLEEFSVYNLSNTVSAIQ